MELGSIWPDRLDPVGCALYLQVKRADIVYLSALFEGYDGLGIIKTVDEEHGIVCVLTTAGVLDGCLGLLEGISAEIPWRIVERPTNLDEIFEYSFQC